MVPVRPENEVHLYPNVDSNGDSNGGAEGAEGATEEPSTKRFRIDRDTEVEVSNRAVEEHREYKLEPEGYGHGHR